MTMNCVKGPKYLINIYIIATKAVPIATQNGTMRGCFSKVVR